MFCRPRKEGEGAIQHTRHSRPYTALSTKRSIFCQSARRWTVTPRVSRLDQLEGVFPDGRFRQETERIRKLTEFVQVFLTQRPFVPTRVPHERAQLFRVVDQEELADHLQARKVGRHLRLSQRRDERVVGVQVGDEAESALSRNDLALQVLEENTVLGRLSWVSKGWIEQGGKTVG